MKARENTDLSDLIKRLEKRHKKKQAATTTMAALGLIGFGIMIIPVLGLRHFSLPVAQVFGPAEQPQLADVFQSTRIIGHAAVVYDLATGQILYGKNSSEQLPLASLTKLLTMYAAVTSMNPSAPVTISESAIAEEGDSGLAVGQTFTLRDIARLALVASSNDAAAAIAETVAGAESTSKRSMLASAAAAAGLSKTYANNGTGLDESASVSGGYGSAEDVAKLAGALLSKAPDIARATIEPSISVTDLSGARHTLENTNQDVVHLPNPLLSKTGFTDLAGGNLVVVFDAGVNHPVAVVVLGSTRDGRFSDVDTLVARTLAHFAAPEL